MADSALGSKEAGTNLFPTSDTGQGTAGKLQQGDFLCPICSGGLSAEPASLKCLACGRKFPIQGGIIDFRYNRCEYYFNPVSQDEMRKLNTSFKPGTWAGTVRKFLSYVKNPTGWLDNIVADGRYSWKMFLDLKRDTRLLDLGCSLGNLTQNLAPHVGKVYAMDLNYQYLEFSQNRFSVFNEGDDITLVAGGDSARLPFRDDCMDVVVLSKVLEWAGEGNKAQYLEGSTLQRLNNCLRSPFCERNPRQMQLELLKEIRRILKPEGQIFIAVENRLNYEYFMGKRDHHSLLKYNALLPRVIANFYSLCVNRRPYRSYTHSLAAYKRLMADAGFPQCDTLVMLKGCSQVEELVPTDGSFPYWKGLENLDWKERLKRSRWFAPAFGIIGSAGLRPGMQDGIFDAIVGALAKNGIEQGPLDIHKYEITGKQKLVVHASSGRDRLFIKLPFNLEAVKSEHNNYVMLEWLATHKPELNGLPSAITSGRFEQQKFFAETAVQGRPLREFIRGTQRFEAVRAAMAFLSKLNSPESSEQELLEGPVYEQYIGEKLGRVLPFLDDPVLREKLEAFFREQLQGRRVAVGVRHGDFSCSNILLGDTAVEGVFDWEAGEVRGVTALDAIRLLNSVQSATADSSLAEGHAMLAERRCAQADELDLLTGFYADTGTDGQAHAGLVYLSWLYGMDLRLRYGLALNPEALEKYISAVVRRMSLR